MDEKISAINKPKNNYEPNRSKMIILAVDEGFNQELMLVFEYKICLLLTPNI